MGGCRAGGCCFVARMRNETAIIEKGYLVLVVDQKRLCDLEICSRMKLNAC